MHFLTTSEPPPRQWKSAAVEVHWQVFALNCPPLHDRVCSVMMKKTPCCVEEGGAYPGSLGVKAGLHSEAY